MESKKMELDQSATVEEVTSLLSEIKNDPVQEQPHNPPLEKTPDAPITPFSDNPAMPQREMDQKRTPLEEKGLRQTLDKIMERGQTALLLNYVEACYAYLKAESFLNDYITDLQLIQKDQTVPLSFNILGHTISRNPNCRGKLMLEKIIENNPKKRKMIL